MSLGGLQSLGIKQSTVRFGNKEYYASYRRHWGWGWWGEWLQRPPLAVTRPWKSTQALEAETEAVTPNLDLRSATNPAFLQSPFFGSQRNDYISPPKTNLSTVGG